MMRYVGITATVAILDQLVKIYVRFIPYGCAFFEIPGWVSFVHCTNMGAAFSLLSGKTFFLTILSMLLLSMLGIYACRKMHLTVPAKTALSFVIGGGIGNLLDRMMYGGVTDYIRLLFIDFPVFNLADAAITCAIAVLMFLLLTDKMEETMEENHGSEY